MFGKSAKHNELGDVCKGFRVSAITFTIPHCKRAWKFAGFINKDRQNLAKKLEAVFTSHSIAYRYLLILETQNLVSTNT